jgi:hypothetical protein
MQRLALILALALALVIGSAACGDDDSSERTMATTVAPPITISADPVAACIDALNHAWQEAGTRQDPIAAMGSALDAEPLATTCAFMLEDEFPDDLGVTIEEAVARLEADLDPVLFDLLTRPVEQQFEEVGDSL